MVQIHSPRGNRSKVQPAPQIRYTVLDGSNSFRVFLVEVRRDFQRAKSLAFSVTSVAPARTTSSAIRRSRKWRTKSICLKALRARQRRMPASIHAAAEGDEK
jgi:hypothetical protein